MGKFLIRSVVIFSLLAILLFISGDDLTSCFCCTVILIFFSVFYIIVSWIVLDIFFCLMSLSYDLLNLVLPIVIRVISLS